ncbi:hypothetical protein Tco_1194776 [Tanacetum coccineum]
MRSCLMEVPHVPELEYPEYLVPFDAEAPLEDQPLPADASPTALSLGYVADSDPDEDPEEDPKEDHADYPADGGDGDDEPSDDDDDDDTDDEDEEPFEDEDDDDEEEEHLALTDSSVVPVVDLVPSDWDTKAFETDESAPTPRSPQTKVPFAQTRLRRTRKLYEVGESSTAAPRPTGGHRADYGFIDTMYVEIRRQRAKEVGYGIRDIWVDRTEAVLRRIGRLSYFRELMDWSRIDSFTMRLHDCWIGRPSFPRGWDIPLEYRCDIDSHRIYHYKGTLVAALGQIQALQARDQTHADDPEGAETISPARRTSAILQGLLQEMVVVAVPYDSCCCLSTYRSKSVCGTC